jgi:uncharacterized SAM-dependent methyltransferase
VSPKFFYDPLGSRLFDAITELREYYPTRTEAAIFAVHGAAIAEAALGATGDSPVMIDLGAGNCAKAARLFGRLAPRRYVAVDISVDFLRDSLQRLQPAPAMQMVGVGLDFSAHLQLPERLVDGRGRCSIRLLDRNFSPTEALLLRDARPRRPAAPCSSASTWSSR